MKKYYTADQLEKIADDFAALHDFGMEHGFVVNFRSFYESDHIIPEALYPIHTMHVDGFEDCPKTDKPLDELCAKVGIKLIEVDGALYLDTKKNRKIIKEFDDSLSIKPIKQETARSL